MIQKSARISRQMLSSALLFMLIFTFFAPQAQPASASASGLVISQVYGGGGNAGAVYTHDFIELKNASTMPISLEGLSLQYASATGTGNFGGTATQLTELPNVTLQPGQFFLVQQATNAAVGAPLPTPDYIDPTPIAMAAGAGKVALVSGTTSLGCNGGSAPCSAEQLARIIDLVGYGGANFFEGSGAAPTLSATTAALRLENGCQDTDDNAADFTAAAPDPRNTSSPAAVCGGASHITISQVYGGGGNSGATYTHDFIELFNPTAFTVSLDGWSVQYASSAGSTWQRTNLSGEMPPGTHYLIQQAAGAGGTTPLPTPNAIGTISMSATAGKVALVSNQTTLSGSCPLGGAVVDFVGFGSLTNCSETAPTPNLSNTTAALRLGNGAVDTDNNLADFVIGAPTPRSYHPELAPTVVSTVPASGAVQVPIDASINVTFSEQVDVMDGWFEITCSASGSVSAAFSGGPTTFTIDPDADFAMFESCSVTIFADKVSDQDLIDPPDNMAANYTFSFTTEMIHVCGEPADMIHTVQGSGMASPLVGQYVTVEGVVVGSYTQTGGFNGYYLQEEDWDQDGDPVTSEGIFIHQPLATFSPGDLVRVTGRVFEFTSSASSLTQLTNVVLATSCGSGFYVTPTEVTLPVESIAYWERYEGMLVTIPQELTVTETFTLGRFGEVSLSIDGRLFTPTHLVPPGAEANALQNLNDRSRILLDDGDNTQNRDPVRYPQGGLSYENPLRSGDTVNGLTGVLDERFSAYRIQPVGEIEFIESNPRTLEPEMVGGSLRVAAFNVLNYFNTIDQAGAQCYPRMTRDDCRGADSEFEFIRQRVKIISALTAIDAHVVGLMEIENDGPWEYQAIEDLVDGLNAATAPGTYAFIDTGVIGGDAIRVALIYQPAYVTPVGAYALLTSAVDPRFDDTRSRPVLAQTFDENATGARFTVAVNHLKSKGSACAGDPDLGDGQGNCNVTRTQAALAMVDWLASDPTGSGDADFLIIGDLNSYAQEDPITALKAGGYTNLLESLLGPYTYSYVFSGQSGYLDHALASTSLTPQVAGVTEWHINADEAIVMDYNVEFKSAGQIISFYGAGPYRSSDHDPVIIGLNLIPSYPVSGFYPPVLNPPDYNVVKAGSNVPLRFSLNGFQGMDIFLPGYPQMVPLDCTTGAPLSAGMPASGALRYDPDEDQYVYNWKTEKNWSNTCRMVVFRLNDTSVRTAYFSFVK
jgi:uncharacterized protein